MLKCLLTRKNATEFDEKQTGKGYFVFDFLVFVLLFYMGTKKLHLMGQEIQKQSRYLSNINKYIKIYKVYLSNIFMIFSFPSR